MGCRGTSRATTFVGGRLGRFSGKTGSMCVKLSTNNKGLSSRKGVRTFVDRYGTEKRGIKKCVGAFIS